MGCPERTKELKIPLRGSNYAKTLMAKGLPSQTFRAFEEERAYKNWFGLVNFISLSFIKKCIRLNSNHKHI